MTDESLTCPDVLEKIPLYVGDDLEDLDRADVGLHLSDCASCRRELEEARKARAAFVGHLDRSLEGPSSPSLWPAVRQGLLEEGLLSEPRSVRPSPGPRRLLPLAAAAVLLVALGGVWDWPWQAEDQPGIVDSSALPAVTVAEDLGPVRDPFRASPLLRESSGLRRVGWSDTRLLDAAPGASSEWRLVPEAEVRPALQVNQLAGYR